MEYVLTEPSGIVIPFELRNAIAVAGRDIRLQAGPVVMLLNAAEPGGPFIEHVEHVTRQQVEQADAIAITKIDVAADGGIECLEGAVRQLAPTIPVHHVSLRTGQGVAALAETILPQTT